MGVIFSVWRSYKMQNNLHKPQQGQRRARMVPCIPARAQPRLRDLQAT